MLTRILGLFGLALLAAAALIASGFWSRILYDNTSGAQVERAAYFAHTWLITFGILAGAWIWLLVKTIYYRSNDDDSAE